ncbi:TonB-dependent receptor [Parabacteroides pacaensis]|uniref:TonB-dependent receptor n=1 Tax=Parabacteroides pacaensis TaxID=2086575 RepID=UPI000D108F4F|nr:TonB-dependent receptor [Parabacteroides pacaensis]
MNKTLYSIFCLFCCIIIIKGDDAVKLNPTDANVIGHVIDKKTREHLGFIHIFLKGTTIGTSTDVSGHYYLKNLPEGQFTIVMKAIGYKSVEKDVRLQKGHTLEINFEADEDQVALDAVVVSANRNETTRRLAPSLVNVLDSKLFETTNAVCLAEGLNFQPGVRVENNCQNCGFQQVRINGLEGPYTQILVDSRPIFSALTGVYGLEQIPANMIERVEVMRGGGSALFGSSAIAGTINIITKEPLHNSAQIAHSLTMVGGSAADNNTTLNASLVSDDHKAGIYLFGQVRYRSGYDHDGDGFTELGNLNAKTLGFRSYLKTGHYSKLTFEYHNINEFRRGGNLLDLPPHQTDITEQTDHTINGGGVKFDLFSPDYSHRLNIYASTQHTKRKSYYGADHDENAYGTTTDLTFVGGTQYSYNFGNCLFMPAEFTGGLEYNYDDLEDRMLGYNREISQTVHIGSAFLQNEWKNDRWSFLIGGRFDKHNMINHVIFSPRANIRYNPTKDINLRLSYSSGFRAPQAFDEDLHITAVGGNVALIRIAPNLKEEKSQSLSASVDFYRRFGNVQANFLVEGFYTDLSDVFVLEKIGKDEEENIIMERRNGKGAKVMGINLEGRMAYEWLQFQAGVTLQRSRYKEAEDWSSTVTPQKRMFRSPDTYGYFTSTFTPLKRFSVSLSGTYTGSMLVQHIAGFVPADCEVNTPEFFDMNVKLAYDIPLFKAFTLQVNGGIQNIFDSYQDDFDKGPQRDAGYMYGPGIPRSYFVGCKITM